MPKIDITLAILAGGSGTRFWPAGRRSRPKQVLALDGDDPRPLVEATLSRVRPLSARPPWIVAPRPLIRALARCSPGLPPESFVAEPRPRNTSAAIVLTALVARELAPEAPIVALPADHHVRPVGAYRSALRAMASRARQTHAILTLGLRPDRPATGYGYLELGERVASRGKREVFRVNQFLEKPSPARARRFVREGRHLWNGGTFAFRPEVLLAEANAHLPEVAGPLETAFEAFGKRSFPRALRRAYEDIPSISVDYGIMERTPHVEVVPAEFSWDDLGSWDAVARHRKADGEGNQVRGEATLVNARNCLVDTEAGHVALLGVKDLIVVRRGDAVLVARRGSGERVRDVVERLERAGREDLLL